MRRTRIGLVISCLLAACSKSENAASPLPDIARQMFQGAAEQGHAEAANDLGVSLQTDNKFSDAAKAFQMSVAAGSSQSALLLEESFDVTAGRNPLYVLGEQPDAERSRRYELIGAFLRDNDGRNPKVPNIDRIAPLPPMKLPP